jgi:predicted aspartyl protease
VNRRVRVAWAFLLSLLGCVAGHSQSHGARRLLTIPVEINGVAGEFLIDTGADGMIIDSAFARRLGLEPSGVVSLERNYSTEQSITVAAARVRIGPKTWSSVQFAVLDLSTLSRMQQIPILGIVGTDLLGTITVRLSYSSGTAQVITDIDASAVPVTLRKVRNRYFVPITIGPSTFDMLLDTGTNMTAISNSAWRTLQLSWNPRNWVEGIQSSGSPSGSLIACIPALFWGDKSPGQVLLRDFPLRVILPSSSGSFADAAFAGILGGDILEHFEVTLDLQHASMYVKPDPGFRPDPYEFVTVGFQFFKVVSGAFSVAAVWTHSPAEEAGLKVGDRILSVNGHPSSDLGLEAFSNQLHAADGTPIVIEVERAAGRFILHMRTRRLVCESELAR